MTHQDDERSRGLSFRELVDVVAARHPEAADVAERLRDRAGPIGNQLYASRHEAGMTQVQLAKASGVRQSDISDIENGRGNPTKKTLEKLGVALGIDFVIGKSSAA